MHRRLGPIIESLTVIASAAVAGIACCGPIVIQWLGLLVWAVGGRVLLLGLVRYEIPILAVIAGASLLGRQLARDRLTRWANTLLASVALLFVVLLLIWHIRRGIVMAVDPIYQLLFFYRQTVLVAAAGLLFTARLTLLIVALWRRRRPAKACAST